MLTEKGRTGTLELNLSMKQTQTLSPQMVQSMEILQMGSQELLEYIEELAQENPVLELEDAPEAQDSSAELRRKLEWLESTDSQNRVYHQQDSEEDQREPISHYGNADETEDNLYLYVLSQLEFLPLAPEVRQAAKLLVESLNQNGWLDEDLSQLAREWNLPLERLEEALAAIQTLEPAGVGARTLSECLLLQLRRRKGDTTLAQKIAQDYLDPMSKDCYRIIARGLGTDLERVRAACDLIRSLNPRPGSGFAARENLIYINPDLFVVNFSDHFEVLTNDYYFPSIHISGYYCRLLGESEDPEVRTYLSKKVRQAKWVVNSIEQRRSTLLRCAQHIVELQEDFFRRGPGHLRPLVMADVAWRVGVHESTVSRALKDKYLQCAGGVYPLNYFFSRNLGGSPGEGVTTDAAKALLKRLIAGEDKYKPLSDQKLCQLMAREGCLVSRRTVAKYREELHIPSTAGRRAYE